MKKFHVDEFQLRTRPNFVTLRRVACEVHQNGLRCSTGRKPQPECTCHDACRLWKNVYTCTQPCPRPAIQSEPPGCAQRPFETTTQKLKSSASTSCLVAVSFTPAKESMAGPKVAPCNKVEVHSKNQCISKLSCKSCVPLHCTCLYHQCTQNCKSARTKEAKGLIDFP